MTFGDRADDIELGQLPAGHLDVDLVDGHGIERREHRRVATRPDSVAVEVSEAQVGRQPAAADDRRNGAVEDVDEALRILAIGVAAHRRLVDGELLAAGFGEGDELGLDDRQQRLGHRPAVGVVGVGHEPPTHRVRPWHARLQRRPGRRQSAQALELVDDAEPSRRGQLIRDLVTAALVVGRRSEAPWWRALQLDAGEEAVEGEVEVEARLLAVGDHVEAGGDLVVDRGGDGVVLQLGAVSRPELAEVLDGVQQPAGQRIAADHRRAQSLLDHRSSPRTLHPGVDRERLAGDHPALVAAQEQRRGGDVVWVDQPASEGLLAFQMIDRRRICGGAGRHRSVDGGGCQSVDPDAVVGVVRRRRAHQARDGGLGRGVGVGGEPVRRRIEGGDAGHQHDRAALAVLIRGLVDHPAQRLAGGEERGRGVERHRGVPASEGDVV